MTPRCEREDRAMTAADADRMAFLGLVPDIDPSAEGRPRVNRNAYRDYDLAHMPEAVIDLDGIDQSRSVLALAEWEITAYLAREAVDAGDLAAMAKAKAVLAGKRIGEALAMIGAARALLGELEGDPAVDLGDERWQRVLRLNAGTHWPDAVYALRQACSVFACRCAINGPGEAIPPACPVHGTPCAGCGGLEECKPDCPGEPVDGEGSDLD